MFNRKSSYALNKKDPNAIVYMDANEAIIKYCLFTLLYTAINLPLFLVGTVTGAFHKVLFVYSSGNHHIAFFG